ncbi:hypothetical protein FUA48_16230 [Flavobacterium alkalisoli]|uniref:Uncharacterized protein n=1 Tax=Flavobacterium alkalisoli TaxID=2602769 RepID=A0A5B9FZ38_9FLAO|nr:hypothetical protein [Flavobacterium alkalisoli]QEE51068.1 hypothetical protein FUA48_16230 [Flavobacterium alkalisoli]
MDDNLTFREDKMFNYLFSKILALQTDLFLQEQIIKALATQITGKEAIGKVLFDEAAKQKEAVFANLTETLINELKSESEEFGSYLEGLLR